LDEMVEFSLVPFAYAFATRDKSLSTGQKQKIFKTIMGDFSKNGTGTVYVRFAQIQANDPEAPRRKKAFAFDRKKVVSLSKQSFKIRDFIRLLNPKI
tara:strand:+ start:625 stop:915 length:291 start_codon:yes stop_codon:yes gene_type:complete